MWCGWCQQRCCSRFKISSMLSKMLLMLSRMLSSKVVSPSLLRRPEPTGGSWCQMDIHVSTGVHHGGTTSILSNLPSAQPSRHPSRHEETQRRLGAPHTEQEERRTRDQRRARDGSVTCRRGLKKFNKMASCGHRYAPQVLSECSLAVL